ncbi:winged helix-turn-helix transcriptional regulator [Actinokineospora auranticolor]|uniref:DNA-binding HxlR family transcriptional regulator n=1 Tax=Actinokineospora auranticolor TaxID=155976 RepID=A0A2S6GDR2_9PSEU|nr:winged helix-turn-helix transcriptional regulator [Actinokineospora auranticolor]PPK63372.1 DNA-binding HxlR family transcriptional regulator [Actinokineospora auranticolor]
MAGRDERLLRGLYDLKNLFGDKWTAAILVALRDGPLRRVEILSTVNSYSIDEHWSDKRAVLQDSILARALKKMREQGVIRRESYEKTFPPEVTYSLSSEVAAVLALAEPLLCWAEENETLLARAQALSRHSASTTGLGEVTAIDGHKTFPAQGRRSFRAEGSVG